MFTVLTLHYTFFVYFQMSLFCCRLQETCSAKDVSTSASVINATSVDISWHRFEVSPTEKIIGYIIYYIVAPEKNITHMGIDSCVQ